MSTDQSFVLSYGIDNTGVAGTTGSSQVRVVLPTGFSFDPFPSVRLIDTLSVVTGDSSSITVYTGTDGLSGAAEHFVGRSSVRR